MRERRMSKYIVSIVLALAMVIGIAVFAIPTASADDPDIWDGSVADSFDGGDGSEGNPYQIATPAQWAYFAQCNNDVGGARETGKYYVLTADLYFNEGNASTWGTTAPANNLTDHIVGPECSVNPFVGTLDGNGHTISGVYIDKTGGSCGLFGSTAAGTTATIKNLIITNSYYESDSQGEAGAIIGQTSGGKTYIDCVFVTDSVYIKSAGNAVGGFIGHNGGNGYGSPTIYIDNSVNGANVDAGSCNHIGGFLGNGNGNMFYINNCLNYGTIKGGNYVCGFVGRDDKAGPEINNSVNIGTITASSASNAKQFVRSNSSSKKPILNNCLSIGNNYSGNATNNNCAQINKDAFLSVGFLSDAGSSLGNDWTELASVTKKPGETITITEICVPTALVDAIGKDAIRTNLYSETVSYPAPQWILDAWNDGEITITSTQEWKEFANFVNGEYADKCTDNMNGKTVLLGDDLDFDGEDITAYMVGSTAPNAFKGTFDGQGHTISGVYMYKSADDGDTVGLFGFTAAGEEATLQNLLITNSYFESEAGAVASLLAQTAGGVTNINNIYVTDSVEIVSGDSYSGGIAAHNGGNGFGNPQIYIDSCVNAATVNSTGSAAAGILGNGNGQVYTVSNCLNMGDITGSKSVGGIVGYGRANAGVEINVEYCVNTGVITSASSTNAEKACAIVSFGSTKRTTLTTSGCYYLTGTSTYGVFEGTGESTDNGGATVVVISALLGEALPAGLEESGAWTARGNGTVFEICIPTGVAAFAPAETKYHMEDNTPDWLKDYADTAEFTITTVAQWKEFASFVNGSYTKSGDFEGKTVLLGNDLDFTAEDNMAEYMVGSWKIPFAGTFDGQGNTITGFSVVVEGADTAAIFGSTAGGKTAIIKNLKVTASYFEAVGAVGAIVGQTSGGSTELYNIYIDADVEIVSGGTAVGGLVGHVGQNGFEFIANTPALIVDSCVNAATVTSTTNTVGGILGNANTKNVNITNCLNMGVISGVDQVGGMIGYALGSGNITIDACVNIGTITGNGSNVAAIAAFSTSGTKQATNCYYLVGSADKGVVGGTDTDVTPVAFSVLGGATLSENLNGEKWTARGEGDVYEICIPAGVAEFAPAETSFRVEDNTPAWLLGYADTAEFTIEDVDQWKELANFIKGNYAQGGDFEGKTVLLGNDSDFEDEDMTDYMLGTMAYPFAGTFDGQGYTISGFHVEKTEGDTAGIFASTAGGKTAIIKNLKIAASYFEAVGAVGALIGQTSGGSTEIYNVYVDTDVVINSTGNNAGGLVGHVGQNGFDFIEDTPALIVDSCFNAAEVTAEGKNNVGGILGNANTKNITITNCLNIGAISGANYIGGMIGYGIGGGEISIDGCVNIGTITGTGSNVAAIANFNASETKQATNCYYLNGSAANGVAGGTDNDVQAVAFSVLGGEALPENLNGEKWIARGEGDEYEICVPAGVQNYVPATTSFHIIDNVPDWLKDYATTDEFTIETVDQWKEIANFIKGEYTSSGDFEGKTILLAGDIDFEDEDMSEYMLGTMAKPFAGTFDGQGYTISGFHVEKTESDTAGLFGSTAGGKTAIIKNFKVAASYFEAVGAVGAIIGQTSGGSTELYNIYVDADVVINSTGNAAGGLVGHVGANGFDFIEDTPALIVDSCVNAAEVTAEGKNSVGGILGNANTKNVTITNCLNIGDVTGKNNVGGMIGYCLGVGEISIDGCVNAGTITGTGDNVAAIAAFNTSETKTATNCYYLNGSAANGVVGGTDNDVQAVAFSVLGGEELPENLDGDKWVARGGSGEYEICIPAGVSGFAPATTSFHTVDDTPDWLKAYADNDEFVIEDVDQWKEFANFVNGAYMSSGDFENKTVILGNDLDFEDEDMAEYMVGTSATPFAGIFDGHGYTISGFSVTKEGETAGLFAFTAGGKVAVIKNLKIKASYFESAGAVGAIIGQTSGGSTELYNIYIDADVVINSTGSAAGGLVGHVGANGFDFIADTPALVVDSCVNAAEVTAEGQNSVGGILGNANNKNVNIVNCLNLGAITGGTNVGGILGYGIGKDTNCEITIEACVNVGTITGSGAAIANLSTSGTRTATSCYYLIGSAATGVVSGTDNDVQAVSAAIVGGATLPENLNNGFWIARGEGTTLEICIPAAVETYAPAETSFRTTDNTPAWLLGYEAAEEFTITTVEQWKQLANFIKGEYMRAGDFEGKTILLGNDLDFEDEDTTDYMLGSMATPFAGTFDGNGAAIIGFRVVVEGADTAGIFGSTAGGKLATIRNLVIKDSHFEAEGAVGALIGQTSGGSTVIENVYVTATVEIVSTGDYVGGLVGHVGQNGYTFIDGEPALNVSYCINAASITTDKNDVGGILGNGNSKEVVITNCINVGDISGYRFVGGIAGLLSDKAEVRNCINAGDINGTSSRNYFAEIATGNVSSDREVTIADCYYTDIKAIFVNEAAEKGNEEGTLTLEGNIPYFAIPTVDWEGWTNVEGGLPTPMVIADVLTISKNVDRSVMLTGASVRMDTPTGIRFTAQFSKGFVDSLNDIAKIGILIVPKAYLDEAGEFTVEALDAYRATLGKTTYIAVYNYKTTEGCFAKTTDEYYAFNAVLAVKPANYTLDFCARAFIELEDGTILYSDFNATNNTRNVAAVAESAYNDTQKLDENEGIEGYMNFVEETIVKVTEKQVVGQDPETGDDIYEDVEVEVTKYVYSPYTAEQRAILYNFFYKEPEEPAAE